MMTIVTTVTGNNLSYLEKFIFSMNVFLSKYDKQLIVYTDQQEKVKSILSSVICSSLKDIRMFDLQIPASVIERYKISLLNAATRYVKDNDYIFFIDVETLFIANSNTENLEMFLKEDWFISSLDSSYLDKTVDDRSREYTNQILESFKGSCTIDDIKDCICKYYSSSLFGLRRDKVRDLYIKYESLLNSDIQNNYYDNFTKEYLTKIYEKTYVYNNALCINNDIVCKNGITNIDDLIIAYPNILALQYYQ